MKGVEITNQLKGDMGEMLFKHHCLQRGFAWTSLEYIYENLTISNILEFKFGFERIKVKLSDECIGEIRRICTPLEKNGTKSFVFDFLTLRTSRKYSEEGVINPGDLCWIEVKWSESELSNRQVESALSLRIIGFYVFRILMEIPETVKFQWFGVGRSKLETK